jgi:hypothetical protein
MLVYSCFLLLLCALAPFLALSTETNFQRSIQGAGNSTAPLLKNASLSDIEVARRIVKDAIAEASKLNKARLDHPARNVYKLRPNTHIHKKRHARRNMEDDAPPPLLHVTPETAAAAALIAEVDSSMSSTNLFKSNAAGSFWMEKIDRKGSHPTSWGGSDGYKIYRNVKDYGAKGDGITDDTASIRKAIIDGDRCGEGCNGATNKNAIVYFPSGIYLVSGTIQVVFGTQLIGDANSRPEIRAAASFVGLGVLSTDEYVPNGGTGADGKSLEWYINTSRFYGQIRNLVIDITRTDPGAYVCAIHYQVAQATSMQDVELVAKTGTTQQGMFSENGSGGVMSDVTFRGGNFGFYGGNQQFTAQRMTFIGCKTAIQIIWDWGWTWKSVSISDSEVGFRLLSEGGDGSIGSISVMDSVFSNVGTGILIGPPSKDPGTGTTGVVIENSAFNNVPKVVADTKGATLLSSSRVTHWALGPTYKDESRAWSDGTTHEYTREESLLASSSGHLPSRPYFERKREQYALTDVKQFVHIKDYGAKGDGTSDDTQAVQKALNDVDGNGKILFIDAGVYMLHDTVTVPKNAKIVGECWATFTAVGDKFSDPNTPRVVVRVGNDGDVGNVEMQDLIVLTKGGTAGAILIEWNVRAEKQGSAVLWDVHARVGGALGTDQNPSDCPPITSGTNPKNCQVATMLMHITPKASGLFDNMWLWVADHLIDDPNRKDALNDMGQLSVYVARGLLIESKRATWLYGTSAEHSVFYQYNFHKAKNVFAGMLQTEPPYYQPMPKPPEPFKDQVGKYPGDPDYSCKGDDFDGCDTAWAVIIQESENIMIAGAGTYSWFDKYTQDCIDLHACQKAIWLLEKNYDNVRIQHLITIGSKYMLVSEGKGVLATDNLATKAHPQWSHIAFYDVKSHGRQPEDLDPSDKCDSRDRTFLNHGPVDGIYYPEPGPQGWDYTDQEGFPVGAWVDKTTTYVTIVNLTPYTFKKDHVDCYQMAKVDFADIPPGQSRQNVFTYFAGEKGSNPVDDKAEVYYKIAGTDKEFVIMARTSIPDLNDPHRVKVEMGGLGVGTREFEGRGGQRAINLIITGSEVYGYYTSMFPPPVGWMRELKEVIGPRKVKHVVMPGTHDSGMSIIGKYQWFGVKENTQTQAYNIYDQARLGSRYFDLRIINVPQIGTGAIEFHTAHTDISVQCMFGPVGATGIRMEELIRFINQFTDEFPGEVLFFYVSNSLWSEREAVDTPAECKESGRGAVRPLNLTEWDALFEILSEVRNRCPLTEAEIAEKGTIENFKMGEFLARNGGKGCVFFFFDAPNAASDFDRGFFPSRVINRKDVWAETKRNDELVDKELKAWAGNRNPTSVNDKFYIAQWIVTPDPVFAAVHASLEAWAVRYVYDTLFWAGAGDMTPEQFPTVMLLDYIGVVIPKDNDFNRDADHEVRALAMGLNLYMVSENCDTGVVKHPLKRARPSTNLKMSLLVNGTVYVEEELFKSIKLTLPPQSVGELKRRLGSCKAAGG